MALRLLTARIIEKWRMGSANWHISVALPGRETRFYSLRRVTIGEPIISTAKSGNVASPEPRLRLANASAPKGLLTGDARPAPLHLGLKSFTPQLVLSWLTNLLQPYFSRRDAAQFGSERETRLSRGRRKKVRRAGWRCQG